MLELSNVGLDSLDISDIANDLSLMTEHTITDTPPAALRSLPLSDQRIDPDFGGHSYSRPTPSPSAANPSPSAHSEIEGSPHSDNSTNTPTILLPSLKSTPQNVDNNSRESYNEVNRKEQLRPHRRPKKFNCNECPVGYNHRKNLREHMQTKHRRLRYICDVAGCGKSVAQKKNLARHKAAKHGFPFQSNPSVHG